MKHSPQERMLRETIKRALIESILKEDDTGAVYSAMASANADIMSHSGGMGGNSLGMHYSSDEKFIKAFVDPFADVIKTALGSTKEIMRKAGTVLNVAFNTLATTLIPFLKASYTDVFENERADIQKLRGEYGQVYDRVWATFTNHDTQLLAFMCSPGAFITGKMAAASPKTAVQLLDVATGGQLRGVLSRYFDKTVHGKGGGNVSSFWGRVGEDRIESFGESVLTTFGKPLLLEDDENKKVKQTSDYAEFYKAVLDPSFVNAALGKSSFAKKMSKSAMDVNDKTLHKIKDTVEPVLKADSANELAGLVKKHVDLSKVPQEERERAESALLKTVNESTMKFNTAVISARIKDAGVDKNSAFYAHNAKLISELNSLAGLEINKKK
jgi:hypothetical protein